MTKTIAEYSANKSNPWHAWVMDNHAQYYSFINYASAVMELNAERRGIPFDKAIPIYIKENGLDFDNALDAFIAYEGFRRDLTGYRLVK